MLELKLTANQVEFRFLGLRQIVGAIPVPASVDHPRVEYGSVEVIAEVIFCDSYGTSNTGLPAVSHTFSAVLPMTVLSIQF